MGAFTVWLFSQTVNQAIRGYGVLRASGAAHPLTRPLLSLARVKTVDDSQFSLLK